MLNARKRTVQAICWRIRRGEVTDSHAISSGSWFRFRFILDNELEVKLACSDIRCTSTGHDKLAIHKKAFVGRDLDTYSNRDMFAIISHLFAYTEVEETSVPGLLGLLTRSHKNKIERKYLS